ncbi:ROK family protein [Clostridium polynesiense]|uniref:ROK family protein n=1 Tax=Clostridium polynesiense TaxID=1325933 RepID=UPI0005906F43|nr:ROK family protein [Clostridium polynesiense]
MSKYFLGIDLGGTKICCAAGNLEGNIKAQTILPTLAHEGEEAVLERIIKSVETVIGDLNASIEDVKAIGIGSPGPLDAEKGMIITTPNLPFKNFNITLPLKERFKVPVYLDNDANVAAIGEYLLGAGKGTNNMVYVTVSTGIGGGAILNGKIYRGTTSNALEVGHMTIVPDGPRCNCGNLGCAEAVASGTAIAKRAREAIESKVETSLKNYENVTAYEVFKEASKGDMVAKDILDKSLNYLGITIANIITSFDPEMVIIGGGVSQGGEIVFNKVREVVNTRNFKTMAESCKVVPAGLGSNAGAMGALALAMLESQES